jgi:hypothetical protein
MLQMYGNDASGTFNIEIPAATDELTIFGSNKAISISAEGASGTLDLTGNNTITLRSSAVRFKADGTGLAFNSATPMAAPNYTVTNPSTQRALDVSTADLATLRTVVGTVISDLILYGLYS